MNIDGEWIHHDLITKLTKNRTAHISVGPDPTLFAVFLSIPSSSVLDPKTNFISHTLIGKPPYPIPVITKHVYTECCFKKSGM